MKTLLIILLSLITTVYIFPIKESIKKTANISMTDIADEKEESNKKIKLKEFISISDANNLLPVNSTGKFWHNTFNLPILFYSIETPPPNNNG